MSHDPIAFESGAAEANRDLAAGRLCLRYAARGAWMEDVAATLQSRFGAELVVLGDMVTDRKLSFDKGYNSVIESHIDSVWGAGSIAAVHEEVQRRRQQAYDAWAEEQKSAQ